MIENEFKKTLAKVKKNIGTGQFFTNIDKDNLVFLFQIIHKMPLEKLKEQMPELKGFFASHLYGKTIAFSHFMHYSLLKLDADQKKDLKNIKYIYSFCL